MTASVLRLGAADADDIVDVFAEAFTAYPVMRFVLGEDAGDAGRLRRLVEMFVMARVLRGEPLLGIHRDGELAAAATVSFPGRGTTPAAFGVLREAVWQEFGAAARARYEAHGVATRPFGPAAPHTHLNMIGVRRRHRGTGLGRRLIDVVHGISAEDAASSGVSLTTEDAGNVSLYEHLGYALTGHARVGPGLETWGFFRPDPQ